VFEYCYGFSAVSGATGFADWLSSCQVETTMPFHDYWIDPPNLPSLSGLGLGAILLGFGLVPLLIEWLYHLWHWRMVVLLVVLGLLVGVAADYLLVMWRGGRPFPGNPRATLPHVLKGLYLQRAFADFVSDQQNRDPAAWGAAFRAFLKTHRPGDLTGPTQPPGVIR
jgi:MFS family permease